MGFLSGLVQGFTQTLQQGQQRAAATRDQDLMHEMKVLSFLAENTDDPEIQAEAITGLLSLREGRGKGGVLGLGKMRAHPAFAKIFEITNRLREAEGLPAGSAGGPPAAPGGEGGVQGAAPAGPPNELGPTPGAPQDGLTGLLSLLAGGITSPGQPTGGGPGAAPPGAPEGALPAGIGPPEPPTTLPQPAGASPGGTPLGLPSGPPAPAGPAAGPPTAALPVGQGAPLGEGGGGPAAGAGPPPPPPGTIGAAAGGGPPSPPVGGAPPAGPVGASIPPPASPFGIRTPTERMQVQEHVRGLTTQSELDKYRAQVLATTIREDARDARQRNSEEARDTRFLEMQAAIDRRHRETLAAMEGRRAAGEEARAEREGKKREQELEDEARKDVLEIEKMAASPDITKRLRPEQAAALKQRVLENFEAATGRPLQLTPPPPPATEDVLGPTDTPVRELLPQPSSRGGGAAAPPPGPPQDITSVPNGAQIKSLADGMRRQGTKPAEILKKARAAGLTEQQLTALKLYLRVK